ncbi:competence type IV pilus minor pilin ComGG [Salipaludibacillus sp. CF4.18]|uniref:competence type IV pilus minor pilin ComGG n=1 Tax=Salipaludibacillus sp. CF4.18 TaxID=3373081 RepID=UPI003EE57AE5
MNERGFSLFLVLMVLSLSSMLFIHFLVLYENEKRFLEMEQDQYRMEQLIFNGVVEIQKQIDEVEEVTLMKGELSYLEGVVKYEIEGSNTNMEIILEVITNRSRQKRVKYNYDRNTKNISGWIEGNI